MASDQASVPIGRQSLLVRGVVTLCAVTVVTTIIGVAFQHFTRPTRSHPIVSEHLGLTQYASEALVEAHLTAMSDRYLAISTTPQFRAVLEAEHGPTLEHYAREVRASQGAAWIAFRDATWAVRAEAGETVTPASFPTERGSAYSVVDDTLVAITATTIMTPAGPVGDLIAVEEIDETTIQQWIEVDRKGQREAQLGIALSLASTLFGIVAITVVFWRGLVGPLRRVRAASDDIGAGRFATRVRVEHRDEIGMLARSINEMAEQLEHHDRHLNEQVRERTRELQEATTEALRAAAEAEEANRAKSVFLANMSHEIRTPMNGVVGLAELLGEAELGDQERQWVELIRFSGDHLMRIINEMLDLAKVEAGRLQLDAESFDPREVVHRAVSLFEEQAAEKTVTLSVGVGADVPATLQGDRTRVAQVLANLVGNAVKFTDRGRVEVRVDLVETNDEGTLLLFEVEDDGIGIAPEAIERIFDPFVQADETTTTRFGGTGLGLSISSQLVELMGGRIAVDSEVDKGSLFSFTALFARTEGTPPLESSTLNTPRVSKPTRARRVLVAEDNVVNQQVASSMLSALNCRVDIVDNGLEAVEAFRRNCYDVVFLDWRMPEMDGIEAVRAMRDEERRGDRTRTRIVVVTANVSDSDRQHTAAAGFDGFVGKPFTLAEMREALEGDDAEDD